MKDKDEMPGLEGLLNGVPLSPKEQWRMAARVNSIRDIIIEFIAAKVSAEEETDYTETKEMLVERQKEIENKYLTAMNEARSKNIEEKAKEARYRRFQ